MTSQPPRSDATGTAGRPASRPAGGATAGPPAGSPSPAAAPEPASLPTGDDLLYDLPDDPDPTAEEAAMTSSLSDPDHSCTMFCDCPAANFVAGGTAALRVPPPSGKGASSVREAVNRAADSHRAATKYGKR